MSRSIDVLHDVSYHLSAWQTPLQLLLSYLAEDKDDSLGPLLHLFSHPALHQSHVDAAGVNVAHAAKHTRPHVVLQGQVTALRDQSLYVCLPPLSPDLLATVLCEDVKEGQL